MKRKGFVKLSLLVASLVLTFAVLPSIFFFLRYVGPNACPFCNKSWSVRTVYPEKPITIPTNPNYLKDKFNIEPRSFPYDKVELNHATLSKLINLIKLETNWKYIASFKVGANSYVTLIKKDGTNLFFVVYWMNKSEPLILRSSYEEAKYIGKVVYESKLVNDCSFSNVYYKTKGEIDYYELNIKIVSSDGSVIAGTIYHIYDFTTEEGYLGTELIYSVTAAGYFWVNYGIEVWFDQDLSYYNIYDSAWRPCWFNHYVVASNGPSASIRAEGRASSNTYGIVANFELWATVSVDLYAQGYHNGGGNFYTSLGWPCGP